LPVPVSPRKVTGTAVAATRTSASSCSRSATTKVAGPAVRSSMSSARRSGTSGQTAGTASRNMRKVWPTSRMSPSPSWACVVTTPFSPVPFLDPASSNHPAAADGHQPRVLLRHARVGISRIQLLDAAGGLAPRVRRRPPPELDDVDAVEEVAAG
jgi:hypothetical protein